MSGEIDAQTKDRVPYIASTGAVMAMNVFTGCLEKKHFMHLICLYIRADRQGF